MKEIRMYLTKEMLSVEFTSSGESFQCLPSITIDTKNIIRAIGEQQSTEGECIKWPLLELPLTEESERQLSLIIQHSLYQLYSKKPFWKRLFTMAPRVELFLSSELSLCEKWFKQSNEELGVKSINIAVIS